MAAHKGVLEAISKKAELRIAGCLKRLYWS